MLKINKPRYNRKSRVFAYKAATLSPLIAVKFIEHYAEADGHTKLNRHTCAVCKSLL